MVLGLIVIIILCTLVVFGIVSLISMQIARKSAAPFFPTPARAIRDALRAADLKPGELFYDLGAGTGKALIIAEKEFGAKAIGFEISILFYLIAKINLFLRGSRAQVFFKNFWDEPLADADVAFVFLAIRTMAKAAAKLNGELRSGTRMIAYAFPIPGLTPIKTMHVSGNWNMFIYIR